MKSPETGEAGHYKLNEAGNRPLWMFARGWRYTEWSSHSHRTVRPFMLFYDAEDCRCLLAPDADAAALALLEPVGFEDVRAALARLRRLCLTIEDREHLWHCLPALLVALIDAATPDGSLVNFERFVQSVPSRTALFAELAEHPRSVEILFRLFVGSQFLTEILLRNPAFLQRLTIHKGLAEIKSREQFADEARDAIAGLPTLREQLDGLRRHQQWELLRIAACDTFNLVDLKTVTLQLALLADALVQTCLELVGRRLQVDVREFAVLAFGKLGGEELNYSSDIDLVFVVRSGAERYWGVAQKLIQAISESTSEGFLYRVDMRLRPWGQSGGLVTTIDTYEDYLRRHGQLWERQALLKARCIAGAQDVGRELLARLEPLVFAVDPEEARRSVRQMKQRIEQNLSADAAWREVKNGPGGIRDVEFLAQYLQLAQGRNRPEVRSINTLDGLIRLADRDVLLPGEYRHLSSGYVFQRVVEHSLQLMHNKQQHTLPASPRELAYLARRLDFPSAGHFVSHYREHRRFVRDIFERHLDPQGPRIDSHVPERGPLVRHLGAAARGYSELFSDADAERHLQLLDRLDDERIVAIDARPAEDGRWTLTVVGYDRLGDLSLMCGLLFASGHNIESGYVFTGADVAEPAGERAAGPMVRKFVNVFVVRPRERVATDKTWQAYEQELSDLRRLAAAGNVREAQGRLARRVAAALETSPDRDRRMFPVEIAIDNDAISDATVMHIRGEDTPGFLYELSNALTVSRVSIQRVLIESDANSVTDTLFITTADGRKITEPSHLHELRAAVVLTKQFTHLLPSSPNPESALLHFRAFLENLFRQERWIEQLASLQQPEVLEALARLLGGSDFLWEDFLRLQHSNLFPVVTDVEGLQESRTFDMLRKDLAARLKGIADPAEKRRVLNDFKDREMFRVDMRHILDLQHRFGMFSQELTWIVEVVVAAAYRMCRDELTALHGKPRRADGEECRVAVCALGKCGGRELGFASDIELMFVYEADGFTDGPARISNTDFFVRLVESFRKAIHARQQGIFEIDLRLRPYGKAGSLAVSLEMFERYFRPDGPAWPYERQALVKLRPIAGSSEFGEQVVQLRDEVVYTGEPFDAAAMRGMRERQVTELVKAGTFNAKLSPGGLVDCEYFVQALQITRGREHPALREPNTRVVLKALETAGIIKDRRPLRDAYRFLRRLIDALRMVRGDARDLTVPPVESEEFEFLARRLGYEHKLSELQKDLERQTGVVRKHDQQLETLIARRESAATGPPGR